jgi:dUTP pyrophosphatase
MENSISPKELEELNKLFEKIKKDSGIEPDENYQEILIDSLGLNIEDMDEDYDTFLKTRPMQVKKLHPDAVLPKYNYGSDSGFDLYSTEKVTIGPLSRELVPTGICVHFDENLELQVRPKSGLALNMGLTVLNTPGTVDQGYTGEIKVIVFNTNSNSVVIEKGMKIAQGVLCPVVNGKYVKIIEVDYFEETDRKSNGFGSTGI